MKLRLPTKGWLYPLIIYPQIQRPSSVWTNQKAEHLPIYPLGADWGGSTLCCHSHSAESTARMGLGAAHSGGGSIREMLYVGWKESPWEQWILGIIVSPFHPTFSNEAERSAPASGERQVCGLHRTWYTKQMQVGSWALQDERSHPPRANCIPGGQKGAGVSPFLLFVDKYWGWQLAKNQWLRTNKEGEKKGCIEEKCCNAGERETSGKFWEGMCDLIHNPRENSENHHPQ